MTNRPDDAAPRPPSVDALASSLAGTGLPHPLLVDLARQAIADGTWPAVGAAAEDLRRGLLGPVINATGVLLHTNLGRAPLAAPAAPGPVRATSVELDLVTGERGSRQRAVGAVFARLCGAEAAVVVNNNAAAVMLLLAATAAGQGVAVSRGESVEIGGGFRVPDVMAQSGARLVDVGTTNKTRRADYETVVADGTATAVLKVHPSNFRVDGFVSATGVNELATLGVPVLVDLGSGLVDAACPWLPGRPPSWLASEPAARQTLAAGAAAVTFSTDKLFGGPQGGVIAGRADLVERSARHPLMRAVRPGGLVLKTLQDLALAYLRRDVSAAVPFWTMATAAASTLRERAERIVAAVGDDGIAVEAMSSVPGAGSAPGVTIPSFGLVVPGDHREPLRRAEVPILARCRDDTTVLDLRAVDPADDDRIAVALGDVRRP